MSNARNFSVNLHGLEFMLQSSFKDDHFQSLILNDFQNWESNSIKSWIEAISKGDTVVDVGSYLGVYSLLAAKAGARNVISYEPNPNTYQSLRANIRLNNLQNTILPRELGLSDFNGNAPLFHPPGREMSSGSRFRNSFTEQEFDGWQQENRVMVATLDNEINSLGITKVRQ
jgi:FkbM family methyltransferase